MEYIKFDNVKLNDFFDPAFFTELGGYCYILHLDYYQNGNFYSVQRQVPSLAPIPSKELVRTSKEGLPDGARLAFAWLACDPSATVKEVHDAAHGNLELLHKVQLKPIYINAELAALYAAEMAAGDFT